MLLLYRIGSRVVEPSWCGIGGHFEEYELNDAKACVLRELYEEMHISDKSLDHLELRYITLRNKKGEIRQNYFFFAELKSGTNVELDCNEGKPEWVDYDQVLEKQMPFSARCVLEHYFSKGRNTDCVYGGVISKEKQEFVELSEF